MHLLKRHEPLASLAGTVFTTQLRWSAVEKGSFAFPAALERKHYFAEIHDAFYLLTEHKKFFAPLSIIPKLEIAPVRLIFR